MSFPRVWVLLFIAIYLLLPGFSGFGGISAFKTWLYYGLVGLLLIGTLIAAALTSSRSRGPKQEPLLNLRLSGIQIAAFCYLGWTLVSAACSDYQPDAWYSVKCHEAALTIFCYVLMFFLLSAADSWHKSAKTVLLASLSAFCLVCFLQLLGLNPFKLYPEGMTYADGYGRK